MLKSLGNYSDSAPLVLRIGLGLTQLFSHGLPKLLEGPERWEGLGRAMGNLGITFAPMFWGFMAGFTELVGGILLIIGLFVRPTSVVLTFVLFVAAVQNVVTAGNLGGGRAHPVDAAMGLIALALLGAGKWSLDRKLGLEGTNKTSDVARHQSV
ncbi:MAG: DoxX family protein [Acidobacteria bacterium]|nr:DoxX family protein [Acidobacteriota bacterium]